MNKSELILQLKNKFYAVDEVGIHEGKTEAGITVWSIGVFDMIDGVMQKRNLMFYTKGEYAFWGNTEPKPDVPTPEPTFTDRVNAFIAMKITNGTIKFGYIEQVSEFTQKALCAAVISDNSKKSIIISENIEGIFSIDIL